MDAADRLKALADAARHDLSCACGTRENDDHRRRGADGLWLYPVSLPSGGTSVMLKTLLSSACMNDCRYCPLRRGRDVARCSLGPEEVARVFMEYHRAGRVMGLFLSSGVVGGPDRTMDRLVAAAAILRRRHRYRGYIHLKVIPGASDAAVDAALGVASAVSLNVEAPTRACFRQLCGSKDYDRDILRPLQRISRQTAPGMPYARVRQTTQFLVGAARESDRELVAASAGLYQRWGMERIYFSAYQHGLGDPALPGEQRPAGADLLLREHRLYQVDFLMRRYGFQAEEIPFEASGNLPLGVDPKQAWALAHPEVFPVPVNRAERALLLRVPGLGPDTVDRIVRGRALGVRFNRLEDLGRPGRRLQRAAPYLSF